MGDRHDDIEATGRGPAAPPPAAEACLVRLRGRRGGARSFKRKAAGFCLGATAGLMILAAVAVAGFFLLLSRGPISVDALGGRIAQALDDRLGDDYSVSVGGAAIEPGGDAPRLAISDLQVRGRQGELVFEAPKAHAFIDPLGLMVGAVTPRRLEVYDLELRMIVTPDGAVALTAGSDPGAIPLAQAPPPPAPPPQAGGDGAAPRQLEHAAMRPVAEALRRLLALSVGASSPMAALERVSILRGRLVLDDRMAERSTVFEGLEVGYEKVGESARLTVSAAGPNGRWRVAAQAHGDEATEGGAPRSLDIEIDDLSIDELALVAGWRAPPFDFDMPLSARLNLGLGPNGGLEVATGRFTAGRGFFFIKDPDHEPLPVDEITGGFRWDVAARKFDIQPVQFQSGRTRLAFAGRLTPPEGDVGGAWTLALSGGPGVFGSERPGERDIVINASELTARVTPATRDFTLDRFALAGPDLAFAMQGEGSFAEAARRLSLRANADGTRVRTLLRLWPSPIAAHTRAWLLANLRAGVFSAGSLQVDFDEAAFVDIYEHRAVDDRAVRIDFAIDDGQLTFLDGVPPLSGLAGKGVVTGRSASFVASGGQMDLGAGGRLTLAEGRFDAPDFARKPAPASVQARAVGSLDSLNELLKRDALKSYGGFNVEPGLVKGQVDGRVNVDLKLGEEAAEKPEVRVAAQISNFTVERIIGKERLDQATLGVVADASGMRASGQGRLLGAPVRIELRKPPQALAEATLSMTLDDAARAKQGWSLGRALTGPVGVKVSAPIGAPADKSRPQIELDLTRAAVNSLPPGYSKPAGRAAKASFVVAGEGERVSLQNFAYESGPASAQGAIDLDGSGGFSAARMTQVRLSPGDDMRVDAQQTKAGMKVSVRASVLDARPFVQEFVGGGGSAAPARAAGGAGEGADVDLELKAALVTGHNGQTLAGVDMKLAKDNGRVKDFRLTGRAGRAPLSGGMVANAPSPQFYVRSDDGGGLLSFLDLYRRMDGGQLQLVAAASGDQLNGVLSVRQFTLRNEAALRRLVAEGRPAGETSAPFDPNAAPFDRLQVAFTRAGSRLTLRDGVISGPAIGTTLEGLIDFGRDQVALNGTFVPAYGVNNLFAKIPLFGPILGGGSNEGLFAVNFRISGSASAPMLTINPLSAIAPGFLRKIFGAPDSAPAAQTGEADRPRMPLSVTPTR